MPKLTTPEGDVLDDAAVQQQFAEAMAAPEPDEPMAPAPERRADDGQDEQTGRRRRARANDSTAGDERRQGRARTTGARSARTGAGRDGKAKASAPSSYAEPIGEFLQALVITGALVPLPRSPLAVRVRLQAGLVDEHGAGLTKAIDAAAQNNAVIRRGVEALTMGSAGWVLPAVLAVAPFAAQSVGLWRSEVTEDMANTADAIHIAVRAQVQDAGAQAEQAAAA